MAEIAKPVVKFDWSKIMPIIITAIMAILGTLVVQQPVPPVPTPTVEVVEVVVPPAPVPVPTPTPTPTPAPPVVVEPVPDVVSEIVLVVWIPTDSDGKRIESTALESLAATLTDGTYTVTRIPGQGEEFKSRTITVHTSGVPPPKPVPVPPVVVVPPENKGPRDVVVIHETTDTRAALALELTALRVGENDSYIKSNKHSLDVLDDDAVLADGSSDPYVQGLLKL
jgi:hypothetical protein